MQVCYAIKLLWVIVYYTPVTSNCCHIEMKYTLYALMTDTSPGTIQSVTLSKQTDSDTFNCIIKDTLELL
jgi:hypothetical protein